jgi:hypothetical protein
MGVLPCSNACSNPGQHINLESVTPAMPTIQSSRPPSVTRCIGGSAGARHEYWGTARIDDRARGDPPRTDLPVANWARVLAPQSPGSQQFDSNTGLLPKAPSEVGGDKHGAQKVGNRSALLVEPAARRKPKRYQRRRLVAAQNRPP